MNNAFGVYLTQHRRRISLSLPANSSQRLVIRTASGEWGALTPSSKKAYEEEHQKAKEELRQPCKERGLPQTGSKFNLVERLTEVAIQGVGTQLCIPNSHSSLAGSSDEVICQDEPHCEAELDFASNHVSQMLAQVGEEDGPQKSGVISCGELQVGTEGASLDAWHIALAQHFSETSFVETTTTVASPITTMPTQSPGEPKASVHIASGRGSILACSPPAQLRGEEDIAGIAVVPAMMTPRPGLCGMHEVQTPQVMKGSNGLPVAGFISLSSQELRCVCSLRGLDTSGSRQQLIDRIDEGSEKLASPKETTTKRPAPSCTEEACKKAKVEPIADWRSWLQLSSRCSASPRMLAPVLGATERLLERSLSYRNY